MGALTGTALPGAGPLPLAVVPVQKVVKDAEGGAETSRFIQEAAARMVQRKFRKKRDWRYMQSQIMALVAGGPSLPGDEEAGPLEESPVATRPRSRMSALSTTTQSAGILTTVMQRKMGRIMLRVLIRLKQMFRKPPAESSEEPHKHTSEAVLAAHALTASLRACDTFYSVQIPCSSWFRWLRDVAEVLLPPVELRLLLKLFMVPGASTGAAKRKARGVLGAGEAGGPPVGGDRASMYNVSASLLEQLSIALYWEGSWYPAENGFGEATGGAADGRGGDSPSGITITSPLPALVVPGSARGGVSSMVVPGPTGEEPGGPPPGGSYSEKQLLRCANEAVGNLLAAFAARSKVRRLEPSWRPLLAPML